MKKIIYIILLLIIVLAGCKEKITRDKAEKIAIDFVNEKVRFTARTDSESANVLVHQANNQITRIFNEDNFWKVEIFVDSNVDGQSKKGLFIVVIDQYTGDVKDLLQQKIV